MLVPPSKWDTWFGGSRWWRCGLASDNRTLHLITRSAQTKKKIEIFRGCDVKITFRIDLKHYM